MPSSVLLTGLISLGTGTGGYWLKYQLDKKQNAITANAEFKRKLYQGFVENIIRFYSPVEGKDEESIKKRNEQFIKSTERFHKKFVLDASPGVIRAIKNFQQHSARNNERGEWAYGVKGTQLSAKIFKQMRRDMGNSNWGLGRTAAVMFGPVLVNTYEKDMHPLWWAIKRIVYVKVKPARLMREYLIKFREAFYAYARSLEQPSTILSQTNHDNLIKITPKSKEQ